MDSVMGIAPAAAGVADVHAAGARGMAGIPFLVAALEAAKTDDVRLRCASVLASIQRGSWNSVGRWRVSLRRRTRT